MTSGSDNLLVLEPGMKNYSVETEINLSNNAGLAVKMQGEGSFYLNRLQVANNW